MKVKLFLLAAASVSLGACSSIANGNNQAVMFTTGDVEGANCVVSEGRDGTVKVSLTTPEEVQIRRAKAAIKVECNKEGYQKAVRRFESKVEGTTGGNILAGGFVGLGVDAMTGAMFKYPDTVVVDMQRIGVTTPTVTGEPVT
jgi:hypothetical protein